MDGAALLAYTQRRLAEFGLAVNAGRAATLYDAITEGRDEVQARLALIAPDLFGSDVTLEVLDADENTWKIPDDTADAVRTAGLYLTATGYESVLLVPSAQLNVDAGDYVFRDPRTVQLRDGLSVTGAAGGALVLRCIPQGGDIDGDTTEAEVGLPVPCHRAIGQYAAIVVLTADEESDAAVAERMFERTMQRLEEQYGSYDVNDGMKLRHAILAAGARNFPDRLP